VSAAGAEVRRGLAGALAILRREPAAMALFDLTPDGFFRSFQAMLVAAPAYALLLLARLASEGTAVALPLVLLVEGLGYVAGWLAFPLAAALVLHGLGQGRRLVPLVVAGNWAAVLQIGFVLAAVLVAAALPGPTAAAVTTTATLAALAYQWLVVRTALEAPGAVAAGFVLLDVVVSLLVHGATERALDWLAPSAV
jgi:hypothetical protein